MKMPRYSNIFFAASILICFAFGNTASSSLEFVGSQCEHQKDTTFKITFEKDTTTADFYKLLNFIESKGEFSRYNKKHKTESSTSNTILLQKILCPETNHFTSPLETWILEDVFSIRYFLTSKKPVKGQPGFYPKFDIVQYNFTSEGEKKKALDKIHEIGWGNPLQKWNDYYIISNKTRIIVLQSYVTMFGETKNRYGKLIEDEWIAKNNY